MKRIGVLLSLSLLLAVCVSLYHVRAQSSSTPATIQAGSSDPITLSAYCGPGNSSSTSSTLFDNQGQSAGNSIWKCRPSGWAPPFNVTPFQNQDFTLQPGLLSTGAAVSNVYYEPNAATIMAVTTREEGNPVCVTAPVLQILDLGTSPTTTYASATKIQAQTLSTGNTVVSTTGLTIAVAAGHYLGIGFSAGTCVTPPTISAVVTVQ